MVTDCSGLVRWALKQLGQDMVHHATYQYTDQCGPKGKLIEGRRSDGNPLLPGSLVFLQGSQEKIHHVGVYVGDGVVIEAKGTQSGVVTSELPRWDHWGELKCVDYSNAAGMESKPIAPPTDTVVKAEVTNPNTWLNVRSGPSTSYPVQFQVEKGTIVDVLTEDGEWWQIRSGGRIGWALAKYLTPLEVEAPVEPEEPEEPDEDIEEEWIMLTPDEMNELITICDRMNKLVEQIGRING